MVIYSMGRGKKFSTNKSCNLSMLPVDAEGYFTTLKLWICHLTENWEITCILGKLVSLIS